jgi:hypothetical protein
MVISHNINPILIKSINYIMIIILNNTSKLKWMFRIHIIIYLIIQFINKIIICNSLIIHHNNHNHHNHYKLKHNLIKEVCKILDKLIKQINLPIIINNITKKII